jgi:hypothetical protein
VAVEQLPREVPHLGVAKTAAREVALVGYLRQVTHNAGVAGFVARRGAFVHGHVAGAAVAALACDPPVRAVAAEGRYHQPVVLAVTEANGPGCV